MSKRICENCGSLDTVGVRKEGGRSIVLFLILLCFFLLPGLLYWGFAKKQRNFVVCKKCNAENTFVFINTPKGKMLMKDFYPDGVV